MRRSTTLTGLAALVIAVAVVGLVALLGSGGDDNGSATAAGAGTSAGIVSTRDVDGTKVLADSEGRTLYSADEERGGRIRCTGACESFWDPIQASAGEAKSAAADLDLDLGVVTRPNGERQLSLDGEPLYSFKEEGPGQLDGDGFVDDFEGTHFEWSAATTGGGMGSAGSDTPSAPSPY